MNRTHPQRTTGLVTNPVLRRADGRFAFSLIEMMVAITISAFVLTSVAVAIHSLFRVDRQVRQQVTQSVALARLSSFLRRDVHEASAATLKDRQPEDRQPEDRQPEDRQPEDRQPEDRQSEDRQPEDRQPEDRQSEDRQSEGIAGEPFQLTLTGPKTITYTREGGRLVRIVRQDDKPQHREVFPIAEKTTVSCHMEQVGKKEIVVLEFVHSTGAIEGAVDAQRTQRIEAVVALHGDNGPVPAPPPKPDSR